jgi:PAS domain S-box-containing protein
VQDSHNEPEFGREAAEHDETASVLEQFRVLGHEREQEFDRLTRLACSIFNVPMAAIGFVDGERFRFKAKQGFAVDDVAAADSLCMRCIRSRDACVVRDTLADPQITNPPPATEDAVLRFYAGVPLSGRQHYIGTLCLMDVVPRSFDESQLQMLRELGGMVDDMLELRLARLELRDEMGNQSRMAAMLRAIIDNEPECVKVVSAEGALLDMNPAGLRMIEAPALELVSGKMVRGLVHPDDRRQYVELHRKALAGAAGKGEFRIIGLAGTERWMESHSVPLPNADGEIDAVLSLTRDVSLGRREAALRTLEARVLDFISANATLEHILTEITLAVDSMLPDFRASVLLVDGDCLRHGAAPHLPDGFNKAIDGIAIAEGWGGCGTAAFRRQAVIASDIAHDPLFRDFHALAREYRIGACWSTPVLDPGGVVLATFALYSEKTRTPEAQHLDLIARISQFVRIAIERKRHYEILSSSEERYRSLFNLVPVAILEED